MVIFMFVLVLMLYFRDFGGGMAYVAEVGSAAWQSRGNLFKVLGLRGFLQEAPRGSQGRSPSSFFVGALAAAPDTPGQHNKR